ncbi:putative transcription factor & chromatin remodeling ARID family [Helianthus anomalus]
MIYYEGLRDNPFESRDSLHERAMILSQEEDDVIENDMIIEDCLDVLDLILLHDGLVGHERFYSDNFEEIFLWFIPCFLGIFKEGTMPPTLIDGREVSLILLDRVVNVKEGIKKVIQDDAWDEVAVECGFEPDMMHKL